MAGFWLLLLLATATPVATVSKPNIILYLTDDAPIGAINQHEPSLSLAEDQSTLSSIPTARRIQTPTLERLAAEGKRFLRSYAGSPVCGPSRHCLMTGIQPGIAHIRGNGFGPKGVSDTDIEGGRSTIGKVLQSAGYKTGAFGKWGMAHSSKSSGSPCKQGFDFFFGKYSHKSMGWAFPPDVDECNKNRATRHKYGMNVKATRKKCFGTNSCKYFDYLVREKALDFIRTNSGDPFFVYWATSAGHSALYEHVNKFGKTCVLKTHPVPSYGRYTSAALAGTGRDSDAIRGVMAMMEYTVDTDLRLLLELLEEQGIADNTLIIFTSDNGAHFEAYSDPQYNPIVDITANAGLRPGGYKRRLYEGGIRVPTIAWWPGKVKAGTTSHYPFMLYDLPLTLAEVAQVSSTDPVLDPFKVPNAGGVSLYDLLLSNDDSVVSSSTRDWVHAEICFLSGGTMPPGKVCPKKWAREKGCAFAYFDLSEWPSKLYKLVKNEPDTETELYDIVADPAETNNLADSMSSKVSSLETARNKIRTASCPAEKAYHPGCYPHECNIHQGATECNNEEDCTWNSRKRPYKCNRVQCSSFSGNSETCDNRNECFWVPWLGKNKCVDQYDTNKYDNYCNSLRGRKGCSANKNCSYRKKASVKCAPKTCDQLWRSQSICEYRSDCTWDRSQPRKQRCS